jgi:hypothetical protein
MTTPPEDDAAEVAESRRLTQEALAKHADSLKEDGCGTTRLGTGWKTTDSEAAAPYRMTISMVMRSPT